MEADLRVVAERLKDRTNVIEVASWFGYTYRDHEPGPCPVCEGVSRTGKTLKVYERGRFFKCYHCNEGGDCITWVARVLGVGNGAAIRVLCDRVGISTDPDSLLVYLRSVLSEDSRAELAGDAADTAACRPVLEAHARWAAASPRPGVDETVRWVGAWDRLLGMASSRNPKSVAMAHKHAARMASLAEPPPAPVHPGHAEHEHLAKRFAENLARRTEPYFSEARRRGWLTDEAGPYRIGCCPEGFGHKMDGRVVFPLVDLSGRTCGFGGRLVSEEPSRERPKYLNSRDSEVYSKSRFLYGLNVAARSIVSAGFAVLAEGYADVIACRRDDIPNCAGPCGTGLTAGHARLLSLLCREVVLMFDDDAAGVAAARRAADRLAGAGVRSRCAELPPGTDPDDALSKFGAGVLRRSVANARAGRDPLMERLNRSARWLSSGP